MNRKHYIALVLALGVTASVPSLGMGQILKAGKLSKNMASDAKNLQKEPVKPSSTVFIHVDHPASKPLFDIRHLLEKSALDIMEPTAPASKKPFKLDRGDKALIGSFLGISGLASLGLVGVNAAIKPAKEIAEKAINLPDMRILEYKSKFNTKRI